MNDLIAAKLRQQAQAIRQAITDALDIDARLSAWELAQMLEVPEPTIVRHLTRLNNQEHAA